MNQLIFQICAVLPLAGALLHAAVIDPAIQRGREQRVIQRWRIEDAHQMILRQPEPSPQEELVAAPEYLPDDSVTGLLVAASRSVLRTETGLREPGELFRIRSGSSIGSVPDRGWPAVDTSRPGWRSGVTWRVTGTLQYTPKGQPGKEALLGWEVEERWDEKRREWNVTRITTIPRPDVPSPRAMDAALRAL